MLDLSSSGAGAVVSVPHNQPKSRAIKVIVPDR